MSRFHQLVAGKTGNGAGGAAPSIGRVAGHCAHVVALKRPSTAAMTTVAALIFIATFRRSGALCSWHNTAGRRDEATPGVSVACPHVGTLTRRPPPASL